MSEPTCVVVTLASLEEAKLFLQHCRSAGIPDGKTSVVTGIEEARLSLEIARDKTPLSAKWRQIVKAIDACNDALKEP